jgi:hypothetical protein
MSFRSLVPGLVVVLLLLGAAPAQAATVFQAEGGGVFVGGDATINHLFVTTPDASTIRVRAGVGTADSGTTECTEPEANVVECPVTALVVEVAADGEDDVVDVDGPIATRMFGGDGDDVLRGGSAGDQLVGEAGDDQLFGRGGDDDLRGDDGNDRLDGEEGSDLTIGGLGGDRFEDTGAGGVDSVSYKVDSVGSGVRVSVGDGANDGQNDGLERDDVLAGFERIQGSNFNDVLRGSGAAETINGSAGDDDIDGGGGADTIEGNGGNDTLRAQDGIADTRVDCDSPSDPAETVGTRTSPSSTPRGRLRSRPAARASAAAGRAAAVAGALLPAPRSGGAAQHRPPEPPRRRPVGQRVFCGPGTWTENPSFEYSWFVVAASAPRARSPTARATCPSPPTVASASPASWSPAPTASRAPPRRARSHRSRRGSSRPRRPGWSAGSPTTPPPPAGA